MEKDKVILLFMAVLSIFIAVESALHYLQPLIVDKTSGNIGLTEIIRPSIGYGILGASLLILILSAFLFFKKYYVLKKAKLEK